MNSLLIGALGAIDIYYLNQDIFLLASLAGWTDQPPAPHPYFAAFALGCVVTLWVAHRVWQRARGPARA
ncbi:MAG TPA: hypothetical protein VFT55_06285 [Planctomycetota bacterium]|nr:hypothetical protein [Planctomycetota bacterium]